MYHDFQLYHTDPCLDQKKFVVKEILKLFSNAKYEVIDEKEKTHPVDKSGKSKFSTTYINLIDSYGSINVRCYDWSEDLTKK